MPKLKYPGVAVQEIENTENTRYTTNEGIHVVDLAYQIDCFSRSFNNFEAKDMVFLMGERVNQVLTGENYRMSRVGPQSLLPVLSEKNIMKYSLRFECSLDIDTHTIYKRS